jgi:hypothetical protein
MPADRREKFLKRLSTVGFGTRESVQVMLANIINDIRDQVLHKRFHEGEMDAVITFHDEAELLWRDSMATQPPLAPTELSSRLAKLLESATGPLAQFERKLEHGVEQAQKLTKDHGGG